MNVRLVLIHIFLCVILALGTHRLFNFYKKLIASETELSISWATKTPRFFLFMKLFIPLVILGFVMNLFNSAVDLVLIFLNAN